MSRPVLEYLHSSTPVYKSPAHDRSRKTLARTFDAGLRREGATFRLFIRYGYRFNGANLPRLLWPIFGHPYQAPRDTAALIHDALYDNKYFTRRETDRLYRDICACLGCDTVRRWTEWFFIRLFGARYWRNSHPDHLITLKRDGIAIPPRLSNGQIPKSQYHISTLNSQHSQK